MDYFNEKINIHLNRNQFFEGTQGSIYEDGFFMFKIVFNTSYPESSPSINLWNIIFHPHVNSLGWACIAPCKNDIISVLEIVESMVLDYDAEVDHVYGKEQKRLFLENPDKFFEKEKK